MAVDDGRGGQVAVEHLLELGAGRIAMVNGPTSLRQCSDRRRGARPDAVFCTNDLLAIGVTRRLVQAGVAVPDEVAVMGYDDTDLAAEAPIPLTSIGQPKYELGHVATELLLKEIPAGRDARHERVVFQPQLTVRESTTAAPQRVAALGA